MMTSKAMISFRDPDYKYPFKPNSEYGPDEGSAWNFLDYFMQKQGNEDARQILRHWALLEYLGPYVFLVFQVDPNENLTYLPLSE